MTTANLQSQLADARHKFLIHVTFVDGSQSYELADTKEDANLILTQTISDPEVTDWVAYEVIKTK